MSTEAIFRGENKNIFLKIVLVFYMSSYPDIRKECLTKTIHSHCVKENNVFFKKDIITFPDTVFLHNAFQHYHTQ